MEVEEPNPEGGVAIRRKGWLAVSFKIKIEKELDQVNSANLLLMFWCLDNTGTGSLEDGPSWYMVVLGQ